MTSFDDQLAPGNRLAMITQEIGYALWQLQNLEETTAQYFVLLTQAKPQMGIEAGKILFEKASKKTFGTTIHALVKTECLSSEIKRRFIALLKERNWLVHSSLRDNRRAVHEDAAAQKLMTRLIEISDETLVLHKHIGHLIENYTKSCGVSTARIDKLTEELLNEWRGYNT